LEVAFSLIEAENIKLKDHFEKSKRNNINIDSILKEKTVKFKEFVENYEKFVRTLHNWENASVESIIDEWKLIKTNDYFEGVPNKCISKKIISKPDLHNSVFDPGTHVTFYRMAFGSSEFMTPLRYH